MSDVFLRHVRVQRLLLLAVSVLDLFHVLQSTNVEIKDKLA